MKKQILIFLLFWFSNYHAQTLHLEYDFYLKSPVVATAFHQSAHLAVNGEQSIYEVLPVDNMVEGTQDAGNGSLVVMKKDNSKYIQYSDRANVFVEDKLQGKIYYLKEEKPKLNWIKSDETKLADGITLSKATVAFRGRTYVIWYNPKVIVPVGPWKFFGLNYLIVEAYSEDGKARWNLKNKPASQQTEIVNPLSQIAADQFMSYTQYPELAYGLSPALKKALSKNPNNKIFEQPRTQLETRFEWE